MLSAASAEIHQVAVALHERLDVVVDVFGGARMRDDEGVLVGVRRLDLGGEAVVQRELGLVLVDDAREVARRSWSTSWTARPAAIAARSYRGRPREPPARRTACRSPPFPRKCRDFPGHRLRRIDRVQGEAAALGVLLVALVLHDLRGMRDRDHGAEARGEQLVEGRTRRRHLDPRGRVRGVGEFENIADEGDAALAVGEDGDLLFLQVGDRS